MQTEVEELTAASAIPSACGESTAELAFAAAVPPRTDQLVAEVYARVHEPDYQPVEMVLGFGKGGDLAATVRFNPQGRVDAGDTAATQFRFLYDHIYAVRFEIDIPSHTYSAYIRTYDTPGPGDPIAIDHAFQSEQDELDGFVHAVDSATGTMWGCVHDFESVPTDYVDRTDLRY